MVLEYLGPNPKKIFGSILQLNLTINYGAAFGLGEQSGKFFAIFAIAFLAVVFYIGRRLDSTKWAITLGILAGGITGNLTDRIFRAPGKLNGGVVDWIQIPHWPIFNLADVSINLGVILILILLIKNVPLNSQRLKSG